MPKTLDLVGHRFGLLTVVDQAETMGYSRWHCVCDCGGRVTVTSKVLRQGSRTSCGCRRGHSGTRTRGRPSPPVAQPDWDAKALCAAMGYNR